MKNKLIKLLDLKSILTVIVVVAMIIFTAKGIIGNEVFITTAGMVVAYYFSKTQKKEESEEEYIETDAVGFQQEENEDNESEIGFRKE